MSTDLRAEQPLSLQRTESGWGLFDERGEAVFEAGGADARGRCLARAKALGILRLRFDEQLRPIRRRSANGARNGPGRIWTRANRDQ